MLLHVLAEEGGVHEVEVVGYLLDAHVGVFQLVLDFEDGVLVDDADGCLAAELLDDGAQVLGAVAEAVGVVGHGAVGAVVVGYLLHKLAEDGALPAAVVVHFFRVGDVLVKVGKHFAEHACKEVVLHQVAEGVGRFVYQTDGEFLEQVHLVRFLLAYGEDGVLVKILYDVPRVGVELDGACIEFFREGDDAHRVRFFVRAVLDVCARKHDGAMVGWQAVLTLVEVETDVALQAEYHQEAVRLEGFGGGFEHRVEVVHDGDVRVHVADDFGVLLEGTEVECSCGWVHR